MATDARIWAVVFAAIGLCLYFVARVRARRTTPRRDAPSVVLLGVPLAVLGGTVPAIIGLSETIKIAASIVSIVLSIGTIVLLLVQTLRHPKV